MRALSILLGLAAAGCSQAPDGRGAGPATAHFAVECTADKSIFVIELTDPAKIAHARRIVDGSEKNAVHVMGLIDETKASYNPQWSYHLVPESIEFFEAAVEVCDSTPSYVEAHLAEVGGSFLPGGRWCPWCSRVVREIP